MKLRVEAMQGLIEDGSPIYLMDENDRVVMKIMEDKSNPRECQKIANKIAAIWNVLNLS